MAQQKHYDTKSLALMSVFFFLSFFECNGQFFSSVTFRIFWIPIMSLQDRSALSEQRDAFSKTLIVFISQCDRPFTPQNLACDPISETLQIHFNFWQHTHSSSWTTACVRHIKQQICCQICLMCHRCQFSMGLSDACIILSLPERQLKMNELFTFVASSSS